MSVTNYQPRLLNIPEERVPHLRRGEALKSWHKDSLKFLDLKTCTVCLFYRDTKHGQLYCIETLPPTGTERHCMFRALHIADYQHSCPELSSKWTIPNARQQSIMARQMPSLKLSAKTIWHNRKKWTKRLPSQITATEFNCNLFAKVQIDSIEWKSSRLVSAQSRAGMSLLKNSPIYPVSWGNSRDTTLK